MPLKNFKFAFIFLKLTTCSLCSKTACQSTGMPTILQHLSMTLPVGQHPGMFYTSFLAQSPRADQFLGGQETWDKPHRSKQYQGGETCLSGVFSVTLPT